MRFAAASFQKLTLSRQKHDSALRATSFARAKRDCRSPPKTDTCHDARSHPLVRSLGAELTLRRESMNKSRTEAFLDRLSPSVIARAREFAVARGAIRFYLGIKGTGKYPNL